MEKINRIEVRRKSLIARPFEIIKYNQEGKQSKYNLSEELFPSMNAYDRAEDYEKAKQAGNPLPLNSIQLINLLEDVGMSENSELKNYIHDSLRKNWIATTSVVGYNPEGQKDRTFHNWKTSDSYSKIGDIVGEDGWIKEVDNPNALELILKTKDIKNLNKISNTINSTPMYFWRINSKPSEKVESVVRFDASSDGLILDADRYLSSGDPAFLVGQVE